MPPNTVKVDRSTIWGNPFRIDEPPHPRLLKVYDWRLSGWTGPSGSATESVRRFRACLARDDASRFAIIAELRGKNLACWCSPLCPCHADVLLEIANA